MGPDGPGPKWAQMAQAQMGPDGPGPDGPRRPGPRWAKMARPTRGIPLGVIPQGDPPEGIPQGDGPLWAPWALWAQGKKQRFLPVTNAAPSWGIRSMGDPRGWIFQVTKTIGLC